MYHVKKQNCWKGWFPLKSIDFAKCTPNTGVVCFLHSWCVKHQKTPQRKNMCKICIENVRNLHTYFTWNMHVFFSILFTLCEHSLEGCTSLSSLTCATWTLQLETTIKEVINYYVRMWQFSQIAARCRGQQFQPEFLVFSPLYEI